MTGENVDKTQTKSPSLVPHRMFLLCGLKTFWKRCFLKTMWTLSRDFPARFLLKLKSNMTGDRCIFNFFSGIVWMENTGCGFQVRHCFYDNCSLAKFYRRYADRHTNKKFMGRVSKREREIRQFVIVKNKLTSVCNASVLLLTMNSVITLSK